MHSSLIGKIEKARRYAGEPERISINRLDVNFKGENNRYQVAYEQGKWHCTCNFFAQAGICSHIMALQKLLEKMLPPEALNSPHGRIPV